jgi:enoyl-CoA hydratase/carnithine racemase
MTSAVLTEIHARVGLIRINRPEVLNALNNEVVDGITGALDAFEVDGNIACIVLSGKAKAMDMCLTGRLMDAQEAEGLLFERRTFQASVLAGGPEGGHGGLHRETQAGIQAPLSA